jgi:hypothetical protein
MGYLKKRHCLGRHGKPTARLPHDPGLSLRSVERLHLASYSSHNHLILMLSHSFIHVVTNQARRKRAVSVRSYGGYRAAARVGLRLGRRFLPAALAPASAPAARSARPRSPAASNGASAAPSPAASPDPSRQTIDPVKGTQIRNKYHLPGTYILWTGEPEPTISSVTSYIHHLTGGRSAPPQMGKETR